MADQTVLFARETSVHDPRPFSLYPEDRLNHLLVIGMRTAEQRQLLLQMIAQDVENGAGLAIIDTTGHFARPTLDAVPPHRAHGTYYLRPHESARVAGFNPFRGVPEAQKALTSQQIMALFKDIWGLDYDRTPLLLDLLRSASRLLLDSQDGTLLGMYPLLTNDRYRETLVAQCTDPLTRRFWEGDFATWAKRDRRDRVQPVLTRLRAFLSDPVLRNVLGQINGALDLERVVGKRQILIADLDRTELGAESARLLACLLVTRLHIALEARRTGWPFYIYVPAVEQVHVGIVGRLIEGRYNQAGVVAGVNALDALAPENRAHLLSAETLASFRIVPDDVRHIAPRFQIPQPELNLSQLGTARLAVSGYPHELTFSDFEPKQWRQAKAIRYRSGRALGVPRAQIERAITAFIERF